MAAMATGEFEFVHNVRVPGMLHGRVVRPPAVGATLASVDESSVRGLPGVVKVVVKKNFVGVVAEKPWQAIQAAEKLKATWTPGGPLPNHARVLRAPAEPEAVARHAAGELAGRRRAARAGGDGAEGDVPASLPDARVDRQLVRRRRRARRARRRSGRPRSPPIRRAAASALLLGLPAENVRVIFTRGSGCYGINGADTVSYDAALLSQAVGKPVRVQLSRKDEMAWENYGVAFVIDQRVGVDASGAIVAWDYEGWSPTLGGRPGLRPPGQRDHRSARGLRARGVHAARASAGARRLAQQQQQRRPVVRRGLRRRTLRRRRHGEERARAVAQRAVAVLHRTAAVAVAAAEHVRARVVHGRDRRAREGRSGGVSAASPERRPRSVMSCRRPRRPRDGTRARRRGATWRASGRRQRARASPASPTKATTDTSRWSPKSTSIRRPAASTADALRRRPGLRADLEPRRHAEPDRRRRAAGHEPRARRRSDLGRPEGDVDRLADLPQPAARLRRAGDRERAGQPDRRRGDRRRRNRDHHRGGRASATRSSTRPARACAKFRSPPSGSKPRSTPEVK